ncbi:MAG TPA: hypothetical protein VKV38_17875 [Trebonia sp.]|nr:hypothetical protein [Trebonia sp.]
MPQPPGGPQPPAMRSRTGAPQPPTMPRPPGIPQRTGAPRPSAMPGARHRAAVQSGVDRSGGAGGNERLTALTGTVLLVLLAAEGVTILRLGRLLTVHFFIGMLLLGPVALKASSTGYRFVRYYTGSAPYRRKGPPAPLLRLLGPVIVASTGGVFGSGIMLAIAGPAGREPWLFLHKGSFVVWFCAMTVHVLAYLPRLPRLLAAEFRGTAVPEAPSGGYASQARPARGYPAAGYSRQSSPGYPGQGYPGRYTGHAAAVLGGRGVRLSLLAASLLAGLVIAVLTVHLAAPWHIASSH